MRKETDQALLKALAAEVKARRAALGISQEELALRAEVNRTFVGKIELAMNQPTLAVLLRLAEGLQTPLPELIDSVLKRRARIARAAPAIAPYQ